MMEDVSEMVERVARALCKRSLEQQGNDKPGLNIEVLADRRWRSFAGQARVAIEAMREPTEAMLKVVSPDCCPEYSFPAMIDAALSPSPDVP